MKNPHLLSNPWSRSANKEPPLISVPGSTKKFKRKSREPKRLLSSPGPDRIQTCRVDEDSGDAVQTEASTIHTHRRPMMSQGASGSATGASGLAEGSVTPAQSGGAIDMRIGINLPAMTPSLSHLPASPFSSLEIARWPVAIAQPLSGRLKQTLGSAFPPSASANGHSPNHQAFSLEPPLPASRVPQGYENVELQVQSPKESPRKRVGVNDDGPGHLPELKAIQQTRRLLANARERTRVHTISAAFEALRKQVPCYSYGQKLSKLAILRIACNYILSLAQLAEMDDGSDHGGVSFSQCVEQCTRTLQAEGRSKKRKE